MTETIHSRNIEEFVEDRYISYLFHDDFAFSEVGYRSVRSSETDVFVSCAMVYFNGKKKMIYSVENAKSFVSMLTSSSTYTIWMVLSHILKTLVTMKNQTKDKFVYCENIDISPDHIFIDNKTMMPRFIYLPIEAAYTDLDYSKFEREFKHNMVSVIRSVGLMMPERKRILMELFSYRVKSLEDIEMEIARYIQNEGEKQSKKSFHNVEAPNKELKLISMNKNHQMVLQITQDKFTIGRNKQNDLVLDFTTKISREHCVIVMRNGVYGLIDKQSSFGTSLNSTRCRSNQFYELHPGDYIKLPGISFVVK